jgi:hypothetical protein
LASSCRRLAAAARAPLWFVWLAAAAAVAARPAPAQGPGGAVRRTVATGPLVLAGRVVRVKGADSLPLPGIRIVAHRVGTSRQGPVDSLRSDARGRFSFRLARPDTGAMYVVSTLYAGIGYFSAPYSSGARAGSDSILLPVFDTSSAGAPLDVAVRHLVVSAPDRADGSRDVLDIVQVANPGTTTLVSRDSAPTWHMQLPRGIESFRVGEGDVPSEAVRRAGDSILVRAPFPPGVKQVVGIYVVPQGLRTLRVPIDQPTARLEVLVEDSLANASGAALAAGNPLQLEGRTFRHFSSTRVVRGETAEITFGAAGGGRNLAWIAIVLSALLLASGGYLAARRRGSATPAPGAAAPPAAVDQDALVRQIVALDERYAARQAETPPEEWSAYQSKRASLKAQLAGRLAQR